MTFFFFQAEDGIRDYKVTGVQTCALPISQRHAPPSIRATVEAWYERGRARVRQRSEEHTSELQSPCNLVCRLLLEKKNRPERPRATNTARLCEREGAAEHPPDGAQDVPHR